MNTLLKIILIIGVFMVVGFFQLLLKGGDSTKSGAGGPIGIVLLFGAFAAVGAIWKYKRKDEKESTKSSDTQELDKN
ncbi:MAG: hypothetical protein KBF92_00810 [Bacteroidia bacterium]|jgi:hypothetical protein|uniref:hypothetical protein n=1 Tax=Candidatus Brachybacter algidus TaxID=2982024 RepID=UPI001B7B5307|nr:hypothetical protein [Candidatus Brachybacter algidus]MBK6450339.1 hypothetical protein [Candidatus Brachybacter algidus]MBK8749748.1 hypothetical protein [Candidatus Brachybacter algidus]MBP9922340.1 hypothetical protein [Bacteroidia bacterium]